MLLYEMLLVLECLLGFSYYESKMFYVQENIYIFFAEWRH